MKNHIAFKVIAVVLCAASLLGAIGSGRGIIVMTETGLYDKTVDEVYQERLQSEGNNFAQNTAELYASLNLGSCPEQMVSGHYGYWDNYFNYGYYGYTLKDAGGNELDSLHIAGMENWQDAVTYEFPVSGEYMYVLSTTPESEMYPDVESERTVIDGENVIYDAIPYEGVGVTHITITYSDGSSEGMGSDEDIGALTHTEDGYVMFEAFQPEMFGMSEGTAAPLLSVAFQDIDGELLYEARSPDPVGTLYNEDGQIYYRSDIRPLEYDSEAVPEVARAAETDPTIDPTEEAVTETTISVILPEETAAGTDPTMAEETIPEATAAAEMTEIVPEATTVPEMPEGTELVTEPVETVELIITDDGVYAYDYYDYEAQEPMYVEYTYVQMPEYTMELTLRPGALRYGSFYQVLDMVWEYRNDLFIVLGVSALLFAILAVYLCCAAGRKPGSDEVRAAGLNCIPLDAYLAAGAVLVTCLIVVIGEGGDYLLRQNILVGSAFAVGTAYLACLILVGFGFAFAAQVKAPDGYWWRNTLCGHCFRLAVLVLSWFIGFCVRFKGAAVPVVKDLFRWLWRVTLALLLFGKRVILALYEVAKKIWTRFWAVVKKWGTRLWNAAKRFLSMLPLTWQWLLVGFAVIFALLIGINAFKNGNDMPLPMALVLSIGIILYAAHCFGTLLESAKRMSKGDLDSKVDDRLLVGCFEEFAGELNDLAGVAVVAAQKQLKSERMKTELITNVSHDIKTPLTSIINYVDLLQKPHTEAEEAQYLEVLDRQSQRLKKLIDDLMEMSKASTGNLTVDITRVDAVESVNQALGEFADKLDKAQLTPLFRRPEEPVSMMADGRLVWRVLSNLLSNAVKYALPGTRLYIDLMELEGKVIISLKNISRDELNVDADELMERFVRGDDSRNTEGSGLGLNIAKSLMELQKGQLQLLVDGDLFKVTLIFPGA